MKAAIYLRVSTHRQRDEGLSLDQQRHTCEQRALADGAEGTVEVFEDGGFSGRKADNRPELQRLLSRLSDFDAVYVLKLDRLARSASDADKIMQACEEAEVRLVSLSENFDLGTPMGRAMAAITAVFARLESDYIRQRALDTHEEKRRLGRRIGHAPYGYKLADVKGEPMQEEPAEAAVVRELFGRYVRGDSATSLVFWLNEFHPPRRGKQWYPQTVKQLLTNPAYIGMMRTKGKRLPAHHEALVDEATFERVQQRLQENAGVTASCRTRSLSPVYRCGLCGGGITQHHWKAGHPCFGCYDRSVVPKDRRHPAIFSNVAYVVGVTWQAVEYLLSEEAIADAQRRRRKAGRPDAKRRALLKEREQIESDISYNLAAARAGAIDVAMLAKENAPLNERKEEIDRTLAADEEGHEQLEGLRKVTREDVLQIIQGADIEQQRRFLKRLFERVEIHRGFLRFVPTVPSLPPFDAALPKRGTKPEEISLCLLTTPACSRGEPANASSLDTSTRAEHRPDVCRGVWAMPSTNTPEMNPVVTLFMCTDEVMGPPDDFPTEDLELPEVAAKDVLELNEHLAGGWKCAGPGYATLRLAAVNLRQAEDLSLPAADVRACATTLLLLAQDDPLLSETLNDVANALRHFHVGELGLLGYRTCLRLGRALLYRDQGSETPRAAYPYAIKYLELAADWPEHREGPSDTDRAILRAEALSQLGYALSFGGDHASGEERLNAALALLPAPSAEDSYDEAQTRASILSNLSRVREARDDLERAISLQEQVLAIEEGLAVTRESDINVRSALWTLAELQQKAARYGEARETLERLLTAVGEDEEPMVSFSEPLLRRQLVAVLKAGGWGREAKEFLAKTLAEAGVEAAGISGHNAARHVLDLGWAWHEDYSESPTHSAQEERLLELLNADRELVEQIRAESQAKVAQSEVPIVPAYSEPAHWIVRDREEERVRFYGCILTLQRVADAICPGAGAFLRDGRGAMRFHDFALGEVEQLRQTASRGERLERFWITAGGLGESEGYFNYNDPEADCYCPQPDDERVDLLIDTREVADWEASTYDVRIAEALRLLMEVVRTGEPRLRKCRMPSPITAHWDCLLGETESHAAECGTFYIAERGGSTCGRPVCKQNLTRLQDEDRELTRRAEELAEREWRAAGSPGVFVDLWEKTQEAARRDPKQSLLHVRELLRSSPRKGRGKV